MKELTGVQRVYGDIRIKPCGHLRHVLGSHMNWKRLTAGDEYTEECLQILIHFSLKSSFTPGFDRDISF
ncbi:hypothetical protein RB195_001601 [Necator americanus]|uniref:Uncharacterized protein n=1 Tax=Necator americanus TaxID=51031 RepID=A0ABR1DFB0_NECAM